jgi:ubiquinone/menaquinone biosynthesis C-methylase UbiE
MTRSDEKEMMDAPNNPRALLEGDLINLRRFNRLLGGYRGVESALAELAARERLKRLSLLDVGTGSADIPERIVEWCGRRGIEVTIVALDRDPVTVHFAAESEKHHPEIAMVRGDAAQPPFAPKSFDFVLASQFLHHFTEEEIVALLKTWSRVARRAVIVSDLVRHPLAYYGIRLLTRLCTANVMTRTDAPLSVKRAFTVGEWRELLRRAGGDRFQLAAVFPFRIAARLEVFS